MGTSPRWTYEGYCEIFAKQLAANMGFAAYNIDAGPYRDYAHNVQKLIDFTSEKYVARAYFVNDPWSYSLLAPLWYQFLKGHEISGDIKQYIPADLTDPPRPVKDAIQGVQKQRQPDWYKRWVRLFGCKGSMPPVPPVLSGSPQMRRGLGSGRPGTPLPPKGGDETEVTDLTLNSYSRRFWAVDSAVL